MSYVDYGASPIVKDVLVEAQKLQTPPPPVPPPVAPPPAAPPPPPSTPAAVGGRNWLMIGGLVVGAVALGWFVLKR